MYAVTESKKEVSVLNLTVEEEEREGEVDQLNGTRRT